MKIAITLFNKHPFIRSRSMMMFQAIYNEFKKLVANQDTTREIQVIDNLSKFFKINEEKNNPKIMYVNCNKFCDSDAVLLSDLIKNGEIQKGTAFDFSGAEVSSSATYNHIIEALKSASASQYLYFNFNWSMISYEENIKNLAEASLK